MNDEQIKKMMEDTYDNSKEDSFISMLGDFYNKRTLWVVIFVWVWGIIFVIGTIYCGIKYFEVESFRNQIMYATLFVCFYMSIGLMKVFSWEMMNRNSIKREIKRLELRIAELSNIVNKK